MNSVHTLERVTSLDNLRDRDGRFLAGTVDVTGNVFLNGRDLEWLPVRFGTVGGHFWCDGNRLVTLEGAPSTVGGNFWCAGNRLTSLVGVHQILKRIDGTLDIRGNPIESGGIGLLLVKGLTEIYAKHPAFGIINKYIGQGMKGVLRCQEALHEGGCVGFGEPAFRIIDGHFGQGENGGLLVAQGASREGRHVSFGAFAML